MRETRKLGDKRPRLDFRVAHFALCMAGTLDVPLPKSGTRSYIVDVLLDVARKVICFSRDIVSSGGVLPDVEVRNE